MRLEPKICLQAAALLGAVVFLGACRTEPLPDWPPATTDQHPVLERGTHGVTQHWDESNHWPRYRYR